MEAVVGGSADVGAGAYEHTLFMQSKGQHYRAFVLMGRAPQIAVAVTKQKAESIKSLADFKGAKVGVSAPGSSTDLVLTVALRKAGVQRNEITVIGIGSGATVISAVTNGQVDALSNVDPMMTKLQRTGEIKVLVDTRTVKGTQEVFGGTMPAATLYASEFHPEISEDDSGARECDRPRGSMAPDGKRCGPGEDGARGVSAQRQGAVYRRLP